MYVRMYVNACMHSLLLPCDPERALTLYVCMCVIDTVCMYVRMYVCIHCGCLCDKEKALTLYVCMHVCMYVRMRVCMYVCPCMYIFIAVAFAAQRRYSHCMYVHTYVCMYVSLPLYGIYAHAYMVLNTHTHTHTHIKMAFPSKNHVH